MASDPGSITRRGDIHRRPNSRSGVSPSRWPGQLPWVLRSACGNRRQPLGPCCSRPNLPWTEIGPATSPRFESRWRGMARVSSRHFRDPRGGGDTRSEFEPLRRGSTPAEVSQSRADAHPRLRLEGFPEEQTDRRSLVLRDPALGDRAGSATHAAESLRQATTEPSGGHGPSNGWPGCRENASHTGELRPGGGDTRCRSTSVAELGKGCPATPRGHSGIRDVAHCGVSASCHVRS